MVEIKPSAQCPFQKLEVQKAKRKFSDNSGRNILQLYSVLVQGQFAKLVYELPHKFLNNLRLRVIGNQEILEKSQIRVETQPSAQSAIQKLNFGNNS